MKMFLNIKVLVLSATLAVGFVPGCDDDTSESADAGQDVVDEHMEDGGEHELEQEACTHMQNGPFQTIDAAADSSGSLEDAAIPHTAVTVDFVAITDGNGGWVSFGADEDAEFAFFLSADVPFELFDASDTEVAFEHSEIGSEACDTIGAQYHADLAVGTYKLSFGPTTESSVTLVSEEIGGEHHHE